MALGRCSGFLGPLGLGGGRGEWLTGPSGHGFQSGRVEVSSGSLQALFAGRVRAGKGAPKPPPPDLGGGFSGAP